MKECVTNNYIVESVPVLWFDLWRTTMDDLATDCGAIFEATVFLSYFNDLLDPRQGR